jgi:eukaryotic-like serine/threonine-protein kinase
MGEVWTADRADGAFEQRVAIKLLRRGLETDTLLRRFLQERQIPARLVHPGIARLLDAGSTADGRPFFVMERVPG